MATLLDPGDVTALADRIGAIWAANLAAGETAEAAAVQTGADDLIADLEALDLGQAAPYAASALAFQTAAGAVYLPASTFRTLLAAFNGDVALNTYLTTNSLQVTESFRDLAALCGVTIAPANVFKETAQTLATFVVTGATAGTFVGTGALDPAIYGAVPCELLITNDIGSSTAVTLTMKKFDLTTEQKVVNLTTAHHNGDTVAIGTGSDKYIDCTAIAVTGATVSDAWTVRSKVPRTPTV